MRIVLHPGARSDILHIMQYYDTASDGVAEDFFAELQRAFTKVGDSPEGYAVRTRDIRRANLHRFPYHFYYRILRDRIRILAVRHNARHPAVSRRR